MLAAPVSAPLTAPLAPDLSLCSSPHADRLGLRLGFLPPSLLTRPSPASTYGASRRPTIWPAATATCSPSKALAAIRPVFFLCPLLLLLPLVPLCSGFPAVEPASCDRHGPELKTKPTSSSFDFTRRLLRHTDTRLQSVCLLLSLVQTRSPKGLKPGHERNPPFRRVSLYTVHPLPLGLSSRPSRQPFYPVFHFVSVFVSHQEPP